MEERKGTGRQFDLKFTRVREVLTDNIVRSGAAPSSEILLWRRSSSRRTVLVCKASARAEAPTLPIRFLNGNGRRMRQRKVCRRYEKERKRKRMRIVFRGVGN